MKKIICLLLSMLILLTSCGSNALFETAAVDNGVMILYVNDGSGTRELWLSNNGAEHEIIDKLSSVNAKPVEWTPYELEYPIYTIETGSTGMGLFHAVWCGGTLLTSDGSAYRFDYDFEKLIKSYYWEDKETFDYSFSPCQRLLCERDGVWYTENMLKSEQVAYLRTSEPQKGVSLEISELTEKDGKSTISAVIRNDSGEEYCFGKYYSLEVLLDGEWYYVPSLPDRPLFVEEIGLLLDDSSSRDMTYSLWYWGDLPAGTYRLVVYGMTAEFTIG